MGISSWTVCTTLQLFDFLYCLKNGHGVYYVFLQSLWFQHSEQPAKRARLLVSVTNVTPVTNVCKAVVIIFTNIPLNYILRWKCGKEITVLLQIIEIIKNCNSLLSLHIHWNPWNLEKSCSLSFYVYYRPNLGVHNNKSFWKKFTKRNIQYMHSYVCLLYTSRCV